MATTVSRHFARLAHQAPRVATFQCSRVLASRVHGFSAIDQRRHASGNTVPPASDVRRPTAIVTGAGRGIGRAIAIRLAQDGYNVCINDIPALEDSANEVASIIKGMGANSTVALADVSSRAAVDDMVKHSVAALGPLNTMIANAGISQVKPALELTEEDVHRMFAVNTFGVHNCYASAATQFIAQGPPPQHPPKDKGLAGVPVESKGVYKLIGAASIVGFKPFPLLSHYSATKFAVRGLTQCFAMELADHGITVNAYAPGIVGTKMWELIDEGLVKVKGGTKGQYLKQFSEDLISLGRTSVPEDVANAVHFLASPDSDYVTGQTLVVDGGIVFT